MQPHQRNRKGLSCFISVPPAGLPNRRARGIEASRTISRPAQAVRRLAQKMLADLPEFGHTIRRTLHLSEAVVGTSVLHLEEQFSGELLRAEPTPGLRAAVARMRAVPDALLKRALDLLNDTVNDYEYLSGLEGDPADTLLPGRVIGDWSTYGVLVGVLTWAEAEMRRQGTGTGCPRAARRLAEEVVRIEALRSAFRPPAMQAYRVSVDRLRSWIRRNDQDAELSALSSLYPFRDRPRQVGEAIALLAAAEEGMVPDAERQLRDVFSELRLNRSGRRLTTSVIVERRLWDCLLPLVARVGTSVFRGTLTGDRWLEVTGSSGVAAGMSTLYTLAAPSVVLAGQGVQAIEVDRPTLRAGGPEFCSSLALWVSSDFPTTRTLYKRLVSIGATGAPANGRTAGHAWLVAVREMERLDAGFTDSVICGSLTQKSVVAICAGSRSFNEFRSGLLTRVVAMMPDSGVVATTSQASLVLKRVGGVVELEVQQMNTSNPAPTPGEHFLDGLAAQFYHHYQSRGVPTLWRLATPLYEASMFSSVPDFVAPGHVWPDIDALLARHLHRLSVAKTTLPPEGVE
ncbi:unnamed protein product [Chondrus crispus]|uniref:Uncharacterized protein n=1 Tax=Chondrus crispus TaxID=2769 RepID=R7Q5T7_CHOCR|nr:unnamed protein product [Chondrus crispus]CDF32830.1 unnamed protein product [Chondrus crispus]|eukprot:XP_005712631.1 unnamed protein product [Chondrus crispus]